MELENRSVIFYGQFNVGWLNFVRYCLDILHEYDMMDNNLHSTYYFYCIYDAELEKYNAVRQELDYILKFDSYDKYVQFSLAWLE